MMCIDDNQCPLKDQVKIININIPLSKTSPGKESQIRPNHNSGHFHLHISL